MAVVWIGTTVSGCAAVEDLDANVDPGGRFAELLVSPDENAWLNGTLLKIDSDICVEIKLRPGDTLIVAQGTAYWDVKLISARTFVADHLDRIEGQDAWFTERIYSVRTVPYGREGVRIFPDKLIETRIRRGIYPESVTDGGPWDSMYPIGFGLGQSARTK